MRIPVAFLSRSNSSRTFTSPSEHHIVKLDFHYFATKIEIDGIDNVDTNSLSESTKTYYESNTVLVFLQTRVALKYSIFIAVRGNFIRALSSRTVPTTNVHFEM